MSQFDAAMFLDATTTEALVKRPLIPATTELVGTIMDLKTRQAQGKKADNADKTYTFLDFRIEFNLKDEYPQVREQVGVDKVSINQSISLQLNDAGTGLSMAPGANSQLRRYREATDLNVAGAPFSPRMLEGRRVKARISHREYPVGSGDLFEDIQAISKP
jgi:hypothetical protein